MPTTGHWNKFLSTNAIVYMHIRSIPRNPLYAHDDFIFIMMILSLCMLTQSAIVATDNAVRHADDKESHYLILMTRKVTT